MNDRSTRTRSRKWYSPGNSQLFSPNRGSNLLHIIRMKNQRSNLDTLPRNLSLGALIDKCAMRRPPCPPIHLRIKTFNQHGLPRRLLAQIKPAMPRIRLDRKSLPNPIRIDQRNRHQVLFQHGQCIHDAERVSADGFDGPPDVDDLAAAFEEGFGLGGEVVADAVGAGSVGLVDMDALDGAAAGEGVVDPVRTLTADGVVEDEDFGGAGAEGVMVLVGGLVFLREDGARWCLRRFQNLLDFGIIHPFDLLIILKRRFSTNMLIDLEPRFIQAVLVLFAADVVHDMRFRYF